MYAKLLFASLLQNPLLDGGELTTYIGSIATKPGSADNSTSFTKWQKQGVGYNTPIILVFVFAELS